MGDGLVEESRRTRSWSTRRPATAPTCLPSRRNSSHRSWRGSTRTFATRQRRGRQSRRPPVRRSSRSSGPRSISRAAWQRARQLYDEAKSRDKNVVLFPETETNLLGYRLLQDGNVKDALDVFQLNVEGYPQSANACDSLSDGYLAMGNKEEALKYAQKAIEMLDKDPNATPQFKQARTRERRREDQGVAIRP